MDQPVVRRATWRLDARMRWRLQWLVVALICILLAMAIYPHFVHLRETRDLQVCENNLRKISHALVMYTRDWDETLPPGDSWMANVAGNMASVTGSGFSVETYFRCPKDNSGSKSSYCYNDLLAGVIPRWQSKDREKESRRLSVANPERFPMIVEKHGSGENAHVRISDYDELARTLTRNHFMPEPVGVIVTGNGIVERRTDEQLLNLKGKKF